MSDARTIRVMTPSGRDVWLTGRGDEAALDVPGGRVTLALDGGWSESGIAYTHLTYEPIRSGLVRFGEGPKLAAPVAVCVVCGTQEDLRNAPLMTGDKFGQTPKRPVCGECFMAWHDSGETTAAGILRIRGLAE